MPKEAHEKYTHRRYHAAKDTHRSYVLRILTWASECPQSSDRLTFFKCLARKICSLSLHLQLFYTKKTKINAFQSHAYHLLYHLWQDWKEVGRYQGQPIWDQKGDFATSGMWHWACYWRKLRHCLTFPHTRSHPTQILLWLLAGIPLGGVLSLQFSSLPMHIAPVTN